MPVLDGWQVHPSHLPASPSPALPCVADIGLNVQLQDLSLNLNTQHRHLAPAHLCLYFCLWEATQDPSSHC
jgi:hypothetical protein